MISDIIVNRDGRSVGDDGVPLIGRLRGDTANDVLRANAEIPVIAMFGAASHAGLENTLNTAQGTGANVVLAKPLTPDGMPTHVESLLAANPNLQLLLRL